MTGESFEQGKLVDIRDIHRYQEYEKLENQIAKVAEKRAKKNATPSTSQ